MCSRHPDREEKLQELLKMPGNYRGTQAVSQALQPLAHIYPPDATVGGSAGGGTAGRKALEQTDRLPDTRRKTLGQSPVCLKVCLGADQGAGGARKLCCGFLCGAIPARGCSWEMEPAAEGPVRRAAETTVASGAPEGWCALQAVPS